MEKKSTLLISGLGFQFRSAELLDSDFILMFLLKEESK